MSDYALHPTAHLDLATLSTLLAEQHRVVLSPEAKQKLEAGHAYLRTQIADNAQSPATQLVAHACGTGEEVPAPVIRLMLLLKAQSLSRGYSGAQVATVQRLLDFYNREMWPVVYQQGALGAGDQVPLAHLSLPLLGLGEVNFQGYRLQAADAMHLFSWAPVDLAPGEELALLSGTEFTLAYGVHTLLRAQRLAQAADVVGALSHVAFGASQEPFDTRLQALRPHAGQLVVAERLRSLLAHGELSQAPSSVGETPYSFRCLPQVHGACRDAVGYVAQVLETECNSVTSGVAFFPADDIALTGGNFHGQPLSLALDFMALAIAELGSISERRTAQLLRLRHDSSTSLTPQHPAGSIVSQNKQLCSPASLDHAGGSGVADHVSMGANGAVKAKQVLENTEQVLAIELLTAAQALHTQQLAPTSAALAQVMTALAEKVDLTAQSAAPYLAFQAAASFLRSYVWQ